MSLDVIAHFYDARGDKPGEPRQFTVRPRAMRARVPATGREFITVPDTAGMWWLVPIIGEAS
jgi:hypothetical protein